MEEQTISKEKLKREEEYKRDMDYLGITDKEIKSKSSFSVTKAEGISEQVIKINDISLSYKMILEGKTYIEGEKEYRQTGKAIAGSKFINLSYGILNSFSQESNLLTTKDIDKFNIQFIDAFEKVNNFMLRDRSILEKDGRIIIKLFKDKLINIGDIIIGSGKNMERVFSKYDDGINQNTTDPLTRGF